MESRTIASLTWRLDHGTLTLTDRHVVVCDETGMTADVDVARLLGAVERAGAKMIVVGDDRQLDAVGPGGALTALCERHPEQVWTLTDNLRQRESGERAALAQLRHGSVTAAVGWYARAGRIHPAGGRDRAVNAMVKAWARDTAAGSETLMLAYRRDNVEALNQTARRLWEQAGLLSGPELTAPGGRRYRAGDRIITLAPGPNGAWVTSQAAHITAVNPHTQHLTAVTPDGQQLHMGPDDIGAERLAHGYAITAHRSQGSTVDVAHVLDDGGGRELAYVAMSRARAASHIYVTALDPDHAAQRLTWGWDQQRRQQWITHRHQLAVRPPHRRAGRRTGPAGRAPSPPTSPTKSPASATRSPRSKPTGPTCTPGPAAGTTPPSATPARPSTTPSAPITTTRAGPTTPTSGGGPDTEPAKPNKPATSTSPKPKTTGRKPSDPTTPTSACSKACSAARPEHSRPPSRPAPTSSPPTPRSSTASANSTTPSPNNSDSRSNQPDHPSSRPGPTSNPACVTTPTSNTFTTSKSPKPSTLHKPAAPESDHSGGEGH